MLGRDDELHPRGLDRPDPLPGVESGRIEEGGILGALSPLAVGEGVHPEMGEGDDLELLPGDLPVGRDDVGRLRFELRDRVVRPYLDGTGRGRRRPAAPAIKQNDDRHRGRRRSSSGSYLMASPRAYPDILSSAGCGVDNARDVNYAPRGKRDPRRPGRKETAMAPVITLNLIDYAIIAGYILVMVLVGYSLKKYMKTSEDFFLSGRSLPSWVTGLAFIAENLGALEVMGMAANGAKYGMLTNHFYWVGAIPAMVFLAIFMMPFYYGSRVRSVPEYLKLRYDERHEAETRHLLRSHDGRDVRHQHVRHGAGAEPDARTGTLHASILLSATIVLVYIFFGGSPPRYSTRSFSSSSSSSGSRRWPSSA